MRAVIDKIVTVVELDNGVVFERFVSWDGSRTGFEDVKKYIHDSKGRGVVRRQQYLVLDNGVEVDVSIHEALHILPDRTGVLVVFEKEPYNFCGSENPWFFGYPNNAAIFNADGTLRFQIHNPYGENSYIGDIHSGAMPEYPNALGVLIGTVGHEPEWLYLVDPDAPELISTGKWIRY